jgi:hypothetical protein
VARGLTIAGKIPIVHATFSLFPSKNLAKAQKAYRVINDLKSCCRSPCWCCSAWACSSRGVPGRALIGAGLGSAVSMLVLGAALLIAGVFT